MTNAHYQDAAFRAHVKADSVNFYLMLAYRYGERDTLEKARDQLTAALVTLNAALEAEQEAKSA